MQKPEKGFYYHYRHDPKGLINNYAYEVLGTSLGTEDAQESVVYRPLYQNDFLGRHDFFTRPLAMFIEDIEKDDVAMKRFTKITDETIIRTLERIRDAIDN
jgi:hypothetical protein